MWPTSPTASPFGQQSTAKTHNHTRVQKARYVSSKLHKAISPMESPNGAN